LSEFSFYFSICSKLLKVKCESMKLMTSNKAESINDPKNDMN